MSKETSMQPKSTIVSQIRKLKNYIISLSYVKTKRPDNITLLVNAAQDKITELQRLLDLKSKKIKPIETNIDIPSMGDKPSEKFLEHLKTTQIYKYIFWDKRQEEWKVKVYQSNDQHYLGGFADINAAIIKRDEYIRNLK